MDGGASTPRRSRHLHGGQSMTNLVGRRAVSVSTNDTRYMVVALRHAVSGPLMRKARVLKMLAMTCCVSMLMSCSEFAPDTGPTTDPDPPPTPTDPAPLPTPLEISSGEALLALLESGAADPVTAQAIRAVEEAVPTENWREFIVDLGAIRLDRPIAEILSNRAFRTILRLAAPIVDEHYHGSLDAYHGTSLHIAIASAEEQDPGVWFENIITGLQNPLIELFEENQWLLGGVAVFACVSSGGTVCVVGSVVWLAFKILTDHVLTTSDITNLDSEFPCEGFPRRHRLFDAMLGEVTANANTSNIMQARAQCEVPTAPDPDDDPTVDPAEPQSTLPDGTVVRIDACIDARMTRDLYPWSSWWWWDFEFTNRCADELQITWNERAFLHSSEEIVWSRSRWNLGSGERSETISGQFPMKYGRPPSPLTVWCVDVKGGFDRCYRENDYENSDANWNEL